jgi:ribosome modulation factor
MTKAYLAGFIAGTLGRGWEDCPFANRLTHAAVEWRRGCDDGNQTQCGDSWTAEQILKGTSHG